MAQITQSLDDITGDVLPAGTPTTTVIVQDPRGPIAVEIDLSDTSFKGLVKALDKIVAKGREVTLPEPRKSATDSTEAADARAWAIANRPDLGAKEKGAVSKKVIEAFRAHNAKVADGSA